MKLVRGNFSKPRLYSPFQLSYKDFITFLVMRLYFAKYFQIFISGRALREICARVYKPAKIIKSSYHFIQPQVEKLSSQTPKYNLLFLQSSQLILLITPTTSTSPNYFFYYNPINSSKSYFFYSPTSSISVPTACTSSACPNYFF